MGRSLTLSKFDFQGKPHIFYDDHLQLLRRSDCFVARKIWPYADRLYEAFLTDAAGAMKKTEPNPGKIDRIFSKAVERRTRGRSGLYMQSRFPNEDWENGVTAAPYSMFQGFAELFENFEPWLAKATGARVHGHLFALDGVHYADGQSAINGALSRSASLRDYNGKAFLTNLIWNTRGERQCCKRPQCTGFGHHRGVGGAAVPLQPRFCGNSDSGCTTAKAGKRTYGYFTFALFQGACSHLDHGGIH